MLFLDFLKSLAAAAKTFKKSSETMFFLRFRKNPGGA